jgi:N-acetylglutamate synthase-like GNAT family acetyltransferase
MPRLHITEYTRTLAGRRVFIACREGILRDHTADLIKDIKFLNRHGVLTTVFHNIPNRFANQKVIRKLTRRLPQSKIVRVPAETDFYRHVLDYPQNAFKLIFIERRYLVDHQGLKINALSTAHMRHAIEAVTDLVANQNLKGALALICRRIENGAYERVHVLPAGKNTIKHELFTIEGSGTLIANNFNETFKTADTNEEVDMINAILNQYRRDGYLVPRSKRYIQAHRRNFYVTKIDDIVVGCIEKKIIDQQTIELGALAIATKFRNQRVGIFTIQSFIEIMSGLGYRKFIALTNYDRLQHLLVRLGFQLNPKPGYAARQQKSPNVRMFYKQI